jgi:hypothetical protein
VNIGTVLREVEALPASEVLDAPAEPDVVGESLELDPVRPPRIATSV